MKKITLLTIVFVLAMATINAQECLFFYPKTKGAVLEYKNYDKKNALTGMSRHKVTEISQDGGSVTAVIEVEAFDKKEKPVGKNELTVKCQDGIYYVDMKNYVSPETLAAYKDMDVKVETDNLQIPASLKPGDVLKDGSITITISNAGMKLMTLKTTITNRKVESKEQVTTEAGTFDCYKISSLVTSKSIMTVKINTIEWYSKDNGMIKSESYSDNKLAGSTVLTAIK
ncbi:MAG: hypothetical protein JXB00_18490 [Bacteroidales bacterium]|nr:hypothetical protein [Bacteroidales bacterium]